MDCSGQAALEYILLLTGAILLAAIIIVMMATLGISGAYSHSKVKYYEDYNELYHSKD